MHDKVKVFSHSQSVIYLARNPAYHSKAEHISINKLLMKEDYSRKGPYKNELCRHVYETHFFRDTTMVFGFYWLAEKCDGHDISCKFF
jgi:hypothetical protein